MRESLHEEVKKKSLEKNFGTRVKNRPGSRLNPVGEKGPTSRRQRRSSVATSATRGWDQLNQTAFVTNPPFPLPVRDSPFRCLRAPHTRTRAPKYVGRPSSMWFLGISVHSHRRQNTVHSNLRVPSLLNFFFFAKRKFLLNTIRFFTVVGTKTGNGEWKREGKITREGGESEKG